MENRKKSKFLRVKPFFAAFGFVVVTSYFWIISIFFTSTPVSEDFSQAVTRGYRKPPFTDFVQGWNITRDVNWLLDFSIVGFPKTGTSTLMVYLNRTESVFIFKDERCEMAWNQHVPLLKDLHQHYQPHLKMGIKCPGNLEVDLALKNYNKFFPKTKFIVGLRHPILWFQSFYNHRVNNWFEMPPAQKLIGKCRRFNEGVCTNRANFSNHLQKIEPWRPVFLYEVSQLKGSEAESGVFRQDLGEFLELRTPLRDPMIWVKPGTRKLDPEEAKKIEAKRLDICEDQYSELREVLRKQASQSATWILNSFINQDNVMVPSRDYFAKALESWHQDPCSSAHLNL